MSFNQHITVDEVVNSFGGFLTSKRHLRGELPSKWLQLLDIIHGVNFTPADDNVSWKLGKTTCQSFQIDVGFKSYSKS
jgi:hypothetical protein